MGIAKLYGQKASGTNINGIIKKYNAIEDIAPGDLVELINETDIRKTTTSQFDGVAKTSGMGGHAVLKQEDIIPKSWSTVTTGTSYISSDGVKLTASSYLDSSRLASKACNNNISDFWISASGTSHWIKLEFPTVVKITKMKTLIWGTNYAYFTGATIQGSNDGSVWTDLRSVTSNQGDADSTEATEVVLNNPDYYKYYRIYYTFSSSGTARLSEWQVTEYEELEKVLVSIYTL